MKTRLFRHYGPQKEKFSLGIQALQILKTGDVLIGAGDGTVALLKSQSYKRIRCDIRDFEICFKPVFHLANLFARTSKKRM